MALHRAGGEIPNVSTVHHGRLPGGEDGIQLNAAAHFSKLGIKLFEASLDEISVWIRGLTAKEVTELAK